MFNTPLETLVSKDFPHNWDHAMGVFNIRGIATHPSHFYICTKKRRVYIVSPKDRDVIYMFFFEWDYALHVFSASLGIPTHSSLAWL